MLRANLRSRLTAADLELVLVLTSRGSPDRRRELEARLHGEGPDALLDHPDLLDRLLNISTLSAPSAHLFCYVLLRRALLDAAVDNRDVAEYLAALVLEFGHRDRANRVSWNDDALHQYLVDIVRDLEATSGERKFRVMLHLGNYSLWLAGLFPQYIRARRDRRGGPDVSYYDALGQRGFGLASDHVLADQLGLDTMLHLVAERYASLRQALNVVSSRVLFPGASPGWNPAVH